MARDFDPLPRRSGSTRWDKRKITGVRNILSSQRDLKIAGLWADVTDSTWEILRGADLVDTGTAKDHKAAMKAVDDWERTHR